VPIIIAPPDAPPVITGPGTSLPTSPGLALTSVDDHLELNASNGYVVMPGLEGLDNPPWSLTELEPYGWDGGLVDHVRSGIREAFLPLFLEGATAEEFRARKRRLMRLLNPKRGPVTWTITYPDGYTRSLVGRFVPGTAALTSDSPGTTWQTIGVPLRAHDPYWLGDLQRSRLVAQGATKPFLSELGAPLSPFFPVRLSSSQVIGQPFAVTNPGDVEAFPVWTIHGPGDGLTVTLEDTGETFTLTGALTDSDTVTIDARRGLLSVTDQDGANLFARLAANPDLFALPAGPVVLSVALGSAGDGAYVELAYTPRYLTAA
jgi:hypothetical protein